MNEGAPGKPPSPTPEIWEEKKEYLEGVVLIFRLEREREILPFPGVDEAVYKKLKAEEADIPNYADYSTPVDTIIERMRRDGVRVVFGKHGPENVFVIPASSQDVERDSFFLRQLTDDGSDSDIAIAVRTQRATESGKYK